MKYRFHTGEEIELHYKRKGATLFDCYDQESLDKLSDMIGLKVLSAFDSEYVDTPEGIRHLRVECIANAPWRFEGGWEFRTRLFAVVDVLEDEPKPKEIAPRRKTIEDVKQLQREEAEAEALQAKIAAEMAREQKSG